MRESAIIPIDAQQDYWRVVRSCILVFHPKQATNALKKATRLRKTVERLPIREMELFFHAEPFEVAWDLAGHQLNLAKHLTRYLEIRDKE
jgi:hypothetical protein